jgi:hypothetical protein
MGYKNIVVHLDGTCEDETRLAHAEALASVFDAHLTGLYANKLPDIGDDAGPVAVMAYAELEDRLRVQDAIIEERLAERLRRSGAPNELRKIEAVPDDMRRAVATEARLADLLSPLVLAGRDVNGDLQSKRPSLKAAGASPSAGGRKTSRCDAQDRHRLGEYARDGSRRCRGVAAFATDRID